MKIHNVQHKSPPTLMYKYANDECEYVFCVKGRPFPCLVSPHLPTPTSTLLDYNLVRDLGLKMSNLQCKKFVYAGHKLRILGCISTTVQCIVDGAICGTSHIKASVVLDLAKNLDSECVAGQKMVAQLTRSQCLTPARSECSLPPAVPTKESLTTTSPTLPSSSPPSPFPKMSSPPHTPTRPPPGFPTVPQYSTSPCPWTSAPRSPSTSP